MFVDAYTDHEVCQEADHKEDAGHTLSDKGHGRETVPIHPGEERSHHRMRGMASQTASNSTIYSKICSG